MTTKICTVHSQHGYLHILSNVIGDNSKNGIYNVHKNVNYRLVSF